MRKLTKFKALFFSAIVAGLIIACENDKPEINIPDPIYERDFRFVDDLINDTLIFETRDSVVLHFKTVPYDWLQKEGVSVQICRPDGSDYPYAEIRSMSLQRQDSIWNLVVQLKKGISNGDRISVRIKDSKSEVISRSIVLNKVRYYIRTLTPDTLTFEERDSAIINLKTTPYNLLQKRGISVSLSDMQGNDYAFADVKSLYLSPQDSIWSIAFKARNGMTNGDIIWVKVSDSDTFLLSRAIILNRICYTLETLSPDTLVYQEGGSPVIQLKTTPFDLLSREGSKLEICVPTKESNDYASVDRIALVDDSIWNVYVRLEMGMESDDVIMAQFSYKDTTLSSKPLVLKKIAKPEPTNYSLSIVSDSISAFEDGGQATVRVRTTPWNALLNDSTATLYLTDQQGNPVSSSISLDSRTFMPDSCWQLKISVNDQNLNSTRLAATFRNPDTIVTSQSVEIKRVAFGMNGVLTGNGLSMKYNSESSTYSHYLSDVVDLTSQKFMFSHTGHKVTLNGSTLTDNAYNTLDASKPFTVSVWCYDLHKEYVINLSYFAIQILSGQVSAFETGSKATVRFRTLPANVLNMDNVTLQIVDTLGAEDNQCSPLTADDLMFQPDSTWTAKVVLAGKYASSANIKLKMVCPDTTALSRNIEIRKVTFKMNYVNYSGGVQFQYDEKTKTYSKLLAGTFDFSKVKIMFNHNGDSVVVNGVGYDKKYHEFDLSKPITATVCKYDLTKEYTVEVHNTRLPVIRITTADGKGITDKNNWKPGVHHIEVYESDGTLAFQDTVGLKGRGNNTWDLKKKPYALRIDEKHKVLGMHKDKRWVLLANYKDRTLLRNDAAFWLSKQTELPYTVDGQYVELFINNEYMGNYYLAEKIKVAKNRVNIAAPNIDPSKTGYLVEIDAYYDTGLYSDPNNPDVGFFSWWNVSYYIQAGNKQGQTGKGLPYIFKEPDDEELTSGKIQYFKDYIKAMETSLQDKNKVLAHDYENYIDVDRAIDYALVEELAGNHDFFNDWPYNGPHSTYLYLDPDNKLSFGPCWDFDYHTFMPSRSSGWEALDDPGFYYYAMLQDPKFQDRLVERWNMYKDKFKGLPDYINMMADSIRDSETANYERWGRIENSNGDQNEDLNLTFQEAVDKMIQGFNARWNWIDKNIGKLGK